MTSLLPLLLLACPGPTDDTPVDSVDTLESGDSADASDVCAELALPSVPFEKAPQSSALYAIAGDLTLETRDGDWTLSENWTGCDTFLFLQDVPRQESNAPAGAWDKKRDFKDLMAALPLNTQLFFVSTAGGQGARDESLDDLADKLEDVLGDMEDDSQAWWEGRIHYLTKRDTKLDGWLGDIMQSPGWGAAIDRSQRIRYIGSYADPERYESSYGWFLPNVAKVANEARAYNFEALREQALEAENATVVPVFQQSYVAGSTTVDVELPDAATLSGFDTLTVDAYMGCVGDGEYGDCPAWDYMAYLWQCSLPASSNPYEGTACEPGQAEVLGTCLIDGKGTKTTCRTDEDCADDLGVTWPCNGYVESVPTDTLEGTCTDPGGGESTGTYSCGEDGTGYGALTCGCGTEIGRWITTYHREGRWVYDISPMLPLMADGGAKQFRFETSGPYEIDLDLRFSNQGKAARPEQTQYLFSGGTINSTYNDNYEPLVVDIPADVVKVELATVISGHGADGNNCAEFCNISHHFTVNGDSDAEIVREFPEASTIDDCEQQVDDGTVPNQYGTWWYGRAGWCPGKEVKTVVHDITDQVVLGDSNSFEYRALYRGEDYTGSATIRMRSWLVFSR